MSSLRLNHALIFLALIPCCFGILQRTPLRWFGQEGARQRFPDLAGVSTEPLQRLLSDPQVVISLTTVPGGVAGLRPTLQSLQNQTLAADSIALNLPWRSKRGLGEYPEPRAEDMAGVKVYRTEDWMSLTNVVPTVQRALALGENPLIIVVDDDKIYPPSLVEDHVRAHRQRPQGVSTCRGYRLPPGGDLSALELSWDELAHSIYGHRLFAPERVAIVTGSDSWAAPAELFAAGLWEDLQKGISQGAKGEHVHPGEMMNDIWVSGQFSRSKVPKYVIPCQREAKDVPHSASRAAQNLPPTIDRMELNVAAVNIFRADWQSEETATSYDSIARSSHTRPIHAPGAPPTLAEFASRILSRCFHAVLTPR